MNLEELYEFDLRGYIVYRGAIEEEQIRKINALIDGSEAADRTGKFSFMDTDPIFMELMASPSMVRHLALLLGEWFRFDHAFGIQMTKESAVTESLHAGPLENQRAFFYQWGPGTKVHNGLVKVLYTLCDVGPGDGGFVCVPGSHKANVSLRPRMDSPLVINPQLRAGDALIFTEALVHGSQAWRGNGRRRVLIYSYAPGFLAWKSYETIAPLLNLASTSLQRDLLRPPYVGHYLEPQDANSSWPKDRRSPLALVANAK